MASDQPARRGRKPLPEGKKLVRSNVALRPDQQAWLAVEAERRALTVSQLLRQILDRFTAASQE